MLNFRRKNIVAQNQIDKLLKAKAELECTVADRDQQMNEFRERLRTIQNKDQSSQDEGKPSSKTVDDNTVNTRSFDMSLEKSLKNEVTEMIMINARDPDRPRFTLKELQKVLMEKNQLTVKLDSVQDELEQLRKG